MDAIIPVIVGVFTGNCLFAWFIWGLRNADKPDADVKMSALWAVFVPLVVFLGLLWFTAGPPPHLGQ